MFIHTLSCKGASDEVSTWAKFDVHIYHGYPAICKSMSLYNELWECIVVIYT